MRKGRLTRLETRLATIQTREGLAELIEDRDHFTHKIRQTERKGRRSKIMRDMRDIMNIRIRQLKRQLR